jgi:thiol-disulfide isomerase/thioredoxin
LKVLIIIVSFFFSTMLLSQDSVKPWIGINIDSHKDGVLIKSAIIGTPGARAGLTSGDIVQSIDGIKVVNPVDLINMVRSKGVGHQVKIKYLSAKTKKQLETTLKLEAMPGLTELAEKNLINKKAPVVLGKILSSTKFKNKNYDLMKDKKVKLIEFWATWCGACMKAHPYMDKFAKENEKSVTVLSISSEEIIKVKKYLKSAKDHKVLSGSVFFINDKSEEITASYFVPALPTFILIDKKNIVRFITVGIGENLLEAFELAVKLAKE